VLLPQSWISNRVSHSRKLPLPLKPPLLVQSGSLFSHTGDVLGRLFGRGGSRGEEAVQVTDDGVSRTLADGTIESVAWDELDSVRVMTTPEGPAAEDVFFVLEAGDHGCVVPQGSAPDGFLPRLQALPGFDNEKLIEAMSTAEEAEFACWQRTQH
jgi:hypothetical protein